MTDPHDATGARPPSDQELWSGFVGGDDAALDALVTRYWQELYWYLLLSTGKPDDAGQHVAGVFSLVAAYRRPCEGYASFRSWLYAVATQRAVPPTHPEGGGFGDLLDDFRRVEQNTRDGKVFFNIVDMARAVRQPFLLVVVAGLAVSEAAKACRFTEERTVRAVEQGYRQLARTGLFAPNEETQ